MPELPEVEHFSRLLMPLINHSAPLEIELTSSSPPKKFLSADEVDELSGKHHLIGVTRKGKLICMVLETTDKRKVKKAMFLHMGMTGKISTPAIVPKLKNFTEQDYPPKYTHIKFKCGDQEACFSDPRKFGFITLGTNLGDGFGELAVDALEAVDFSGLVNQKLPIKAVLLDQKRVISGVGNWVADEILYQVYPSLHPEQKYLTIDEADRVGAKMKDILRTAIECLDKGEDFPPSWLFHVRWSKRAQKEGTAIKDAEGRIVAFVTVGGRTSAIVPSLQKLAKSRAPQATDGEKQGSRKVARSTSVTKAKRKATKEKPPAKDAQASVTGTKRRATHELVGDNSLRRRSSRSRKSTS